MSEFRLAHLRKPEMTAARFEVAVLPIGSTEPHAQHLVYGTDTLQVERVAERTVAEANRRGAKCLLLPTLPVSCNVNVQQCPWAMSLQPPTLVAVVKDIAHSVVRNGVRKIVLLNGHGGNTSVLQSALRELHPQVPAFLALMEWFGVIGDVEQEVLTSEETGHACEMETSSMLYLAPEGVDMGAAEVTHTRRTIFSKRGYLTFVNPWHIYTRNTGIGDPTVATEEKGRRMIEASVDRMAGVLVEMSHAPYSDRFPFVED